MKKILFKIISQFFKEEIEDSLLEDFLKDYNKISNLSRNDEKVLEKLSNLYQYSEWKIYAQVVSNRAKSLAIRAVRIKKYDEEEHPYLRGQVFDSAFLLRMVKTANKNYQKKKGNK